MVRHAYAQLDASSLEATLEVDCRASLWEMGNLQEIRRMRELSPFGPGNPEPKVLVEGVKAIQTRWIGSGGEHLKLVLVSADAQQGAQSVDAIWFRAADHKSAIDEALARGPLDLVVEPGINTFNGSTVAQMKIADVRQGA
jgi:single-stranded-DNA-specific exonuclease